MKKTELNRLSQVYAGNGRVNEVDGGRGLTVTARVARFEVLASCWVSEPDYRPTSELLQQAMTSSARHVITASND